MVPVPSVADEDGRRARLEDLRGPEETPLPANAKRRLGRILDRLELVMGQIAELEKWD